MISTPIAGAVRIFVYEAYHDNAKESVEEALYDSRSMRFHASKQIHRIHIQRPAHAPGFGQGGDALAPGGEESLQA